MFCYQCEHTAKGEGCTRVGVCGKQPETAALQDLLIYAAKGLSLYGVEAAKAGIRDHDTDVFLCKAIFSTLTNVNFDPERFLPMFNRIVELREELNGKIQEAGGNSEFPERPANFKPETSLEGLIRQGEGVGVNSDPDIDSDINSLRQILTYLWDQGSRRLRGSCPDTGVRR